MDQIIPYHKFDVSGSGIKIRLDLGGYFSKPVPVYSVILQDTVIIGGQKLEPHTVTLALQNHFEKDEKKLLTVDDPLFVFECMMASSHRKCTAKFEFKDFELYITKIVLIG